jgi:hypothetical protein
MKSENGGDEVTHYSWYKWSVQVTFLVAVSCNESTTRSISSKFLPKVENLISLAQRVLYDYRGPGFLAVVCFGSDPLSRQQVISLSRSFCVLLVEHSDGRWNIRWQESWVLYKSFKILWPRITEKT